MTQSQSSIDTTLGNEGRKDDSGKLRLDLIPVRPLFELARVYTIGAKKYADRNWEKGIKFGRVFSALLRHAWKWWWGEKYDQADGQHHLSSVAWCAFALMEYEETHPEMDDRPPNVGKPPVGMECPMAPRIYPAARCEKCGVVLVSDPLHDSTSCRPLGDMFHKVRNGG